MKALTVVPLQAGTAARSDMPEPPESDGPVLVETMAVGVCDTDTEIVSGDYGWAPPGEERLVLGHESLGRVLEAPAGAPVAEGDLVVGIVRRPDPVPCPSCSVLEWDFCRNGQLNRSMVLDNVAVVGSVNANRRHYELAAEAPAAAERSRLERVVTRRVPLESWPEALQRQPDDVKVVIEVDST